MSLKESYWKYSLITIILVMGIILFIEFTPFLGGILGACTIYILLRKQLQYLTEKRHWNRSLVAILLLLETILCFLIPLSLAVWLFVNKLQNINLNPSELISSFEHIADLVREKTGFDVLEKDINSSDSRISYNAYLIKMLTLLTFNLGDRIGETRVICYSNISKEYNTIEIKHSINYNTKDEKFFSATKTNSSQRKLDASPKLIEEIEKFKEYNEKRLCININPDLPILFNYLTNKPYSDTILRKKFNYYIEKANVPKIRMYDLRHTYVTTMMSEGWELYHISQRLGHTNYSTTVNKYGHISDNTRKEMAKTTDKYF